MIWVGNPAPPRPTMPLSRTALRKDALSVISGICISSDSFCSLSHLISTALQTFPFAILKSLIAVTVPDTPECTGTEKNASVSPIFCPAETVSPTLTSGLHGAPIFISIGIFTDSGSGRF